MKTGKYGPVLKVLAAFALSLALIVLGVGQAAAKPQFSALTVDARTGAVLFSEQADGQRYPASLTKMMTLYIVFQELKAGRIKLSTPLKVSRRAAAMAPSKLGLKPGSSITVSQAIHALVIKSANDVAATVGENLGRGSEATFAQRMTKTARSLGMNRTTFKNASGLPNPGQVTTARDMATLGLRLMRDFPQYYPYFRATSFNFKGRTIRSHNRLVGRFPGTDGIKTGYIGAAGYNLVTSTRRDGKRLVGVVLGARSGGSRNAYMMTMLTRSFAKAKSGDTIAAVAGSSKGAVNPLAKAEIKKPEVADVETTPDTDTAKLAEAAATAATESDDDGEAENGSEAQPQVLEAKIQDDPAPSAAKKSKTPAVVPFAIKPAAKQSEVDSIQVASLPKGWSVQIGTFENKADAQDIISKLKAQGNGSIKGKQAYTVAVKKGKTLFYRVVITGFNEKSAKQSCSRISKLGKDCAVILPQA